MATPQGKWIAFLASLWVALLGAGLFLLFRSRSEDLARAIDQQAALADPAVRRALINELSRATVGVFDTHNDPEVGRVLLANLDEREATGVTVSSNEYGLRERSFALPKPDGLLRVVILGDSHVMGYGTRAGERVGVRLESYLRERSSAGVQVECLHVGVGGWNAVNESQYVRRLLTELRPDLVVQLTVSNDLDDPAGVRGFGGLSAFTPRARARTDALVSLVYPSQFSRQGISNYLLWGLDWESRHRYTEAVDAFVRLAAAVERAGGHYLLVAHWASMNHKLRPAIGERLAPEQLLILPSTLYYDPALRVSASDSHLNGAGHERVAQVLYGVVRARGLLPVLQLEPWPELEELSRAILAEGAAEVEQKMRTEVSSPRSIAARLDLRQMTDESWRQVYTGIDGERRASPYVSVILRNPGGARVRVRGRAFERLELEGTRVEVRIEDQSAGELELGVGEPFEAVFELPSAARALPFVTLSLSASDYVYVGTGRQHCVAFELEELAIEGG